MLKTAGFYYVKAHRDLPTGNAVIYTSKVRHLEGNHHLAEEGPPILTPSFPPDSHSRPEAFFPKGTQNYFNRATHEQIIKTGELKGG
jgi:hypothetical protein